MIRVKVKEDKTVIDYDYILSSLNELESLMKIIYKPIMGVYKVAAMFVDMGDIKNLLNNRPKYNHLDIDLLLTDSTFRRVSLAIPDLVNDEKRGMWEYLSDGISSRNLLINKKVVSLMYNSIGKSYEEIDDILDLLLDAFGPYMQISEKDLSKHLAINSVVYPRTVLISYINLYTWRKSQLSKCLSDISPDIALRSMIKNIKKLHEQKIKYLKTGLGSTFIKKLNTRNLNLMYYTLVFNKPKTINDIIILLELYERAIDLKEDE